MMKTHFKIILAAGMALALIQAKPASAQIVAGNLNNTSTNGISLPTTGATFAQAIQNDPIELQAGIITLQLRTNSGTAAARVQLWSGVGTTPEVLIEDLGVIANITDPLPVNYDIASTIQPELNIGTRYWISVTNEDGAGELVWSFTLDTTSEGLAPFSALQAESTDGTVWTEADNGLNKRQLLAVQPLFAPFDVVNNQDSGPGSLRWAVANANVVPGHQNITFANSLAGATITLAGTEIAITSDLAIDASSLSPRVTLSGNANENGDPDEGESRIFDISTGATVSLHHLIIRDGQVENSDATIGATSWGGGIRNAGALTMTDCDVLNCRARFGGGIHSVGSLTLTRVAVIGNFAQAKVGDEENPTEDLLANGGGIYCEGSANLSQCQVDNNKGTYGGGIWNGPSGSFSLSQSSVSGNEGLLGGGIWNEVNATIMLGKTSVANNQSLTAGAGIYNDQGIVDLDQCTLAGNIASTLGGAIYNDTPGVLTITHGTVAWNSANTNGGGIFNTIGAVMTMEMSIAASNTRSPAVANDVVGSWTAPTGTVNIVVAKGPGTVTGPAALTSNPILSQPGSHGGPGLTVALLNGSPAIDAATGSTITTDQRGQPVIDTPDLGAFESNTAVDGSHGTLAFLQSPFSILEEAGTAFVPVARLGGSLGTVSVTVDSAFDIATDEDFTAVAGQVITFTHGQTQQFVAVEVVSDPDLKEPNETFTLTLSNPTGGAILGTPNPGVVRIVDFFDRARPSLSVLTPVNNIIIQEAEGPVVSVTGSAKDNQGVERVNVSLDGLAFQPAILTHAPDFLSCEYALPLTVAPGRHNVLIQAVDTRGLVSTSIRRFFTYRVISDLAVAVNGEGKVTNGFIPTSERFLGIPYSITATASSGSVFNGWTANDFTGTGVTPAAAELPKLSFVMQEGLALTANFIANPFIPEIIGKFNGLVTADIGTTPASANTGLFTASVTNRGGFSARLTLDGLAHTLTGVFTNQGAVRFGKLRFPVQIIARKNKPTLEVELELDMNAANPIITGTVTQKGAGGIIVAVSEILAKRAHYNSTKQKVDPALAGASLQRYNLILPAKIQAPPVATNLYPQGTGIGFMTVRTSGAASFTILAADNTRFTFTTALSKDNDCPLFAQLYNKLGCFAALVTVDPNHAETDASALNCFWFRPAQNTNQWYPLGWSQGLDIDLFGSKFTVPVGSSVLPGLGAEDLLNGNAELVFSGGLLTPPDLNKSLNITPTNAVTNAPATDKTFTAKLTRTTGEWKGTFTHTDSKKPVWQATTFQKAGTHQGARGFFMSFKPKPVTGLGEGGKVTLLPD